MQEAGAACYRRPCVDLALKRTGMLAVFAINGGVGWKMTMDILRSLSGVSEGETGGGTKSAGKGAVGSARRQTEVDWQTVSVRRQEREKGTHRSHANVGRVPHLPLRRESDMFARMSQSGKLGPATFGGTVAKPQGSPMLFHG